MKNTTKGKNLLKTMLVGSLLVGVGANAAKFSHLSNVTYEEGTMDTGLSQKINVLYKNGIALPDKFAGDCTIPKYTYCFKSNENSSTCYDYRSFPSKLLPLGTAIKQVFSYNPKFPSKPYTTSINYVCVSPTGATSGGSSYDDSALQDRLDKLESTVYSCTQ
ncbi:MAG: hypothetical protein U9R39_06555 [Campylobacterota bacterium]|nr:hypothetical protein [Campylobacterota bacterium]